MSKHALLGNQQGVFGASAFSFLLTYPTTYLLTYLPNYLPTHPATFLPVEKYETANWSLRQGDEEVNKRKVLFSFFF